MLLEDLQPSFQLYALCSDCNRMEAVDVRRLLELLPADTPMDAVRQRVRCKHCGVRTGDIRIIYTGHGENAAVFSYRR
jgi:hypothetical protein